MPARRKAKRRDVESANARFVVEREQFESNFTPYYEQWLTPATLFQFAIYLPFQIPLETGRCVTLPLNDGAASFVFTEVVTNSQLLADPGAVSDTFTTIDVYRTRVEMLYVTERNVTLAGEALAELFGRLLDHLNAIVVAYQVLHHDSRVYRVTPQMLQAFCLMRRVDVRSWFCDSQLLGLHYDVPYQAPTLSDEEVAQLGWYALVIESEYNPFVTAVELQHVATRELRDGFYRDAVVQAQAAIESMLGALYVAIRTIEGVSAEEAEQERERARFMPMVRREFASRLGGNWDTSNPASVVGNWRSIAYALRNQIIHNAYHPSYGEAREAVTAVELFMKFISDLMKAQTGTYKSLARFVSSPMSPEEAIARGAFRE